MQAVLETATNKALYLFENVENIVITSTQMTQPLKALDIKSGTHHVLEDVTKPEHFFGGAQTYVDGVWAAVDQTIYGDLKIAWVQNNKEKLTAYTGLLAKIKMDALKTPLDDLAQIKVSRGQGRRANNGSRPSDAAFLSDFDTKAAPVEDLYDAAILIIAEINLETITTTQGVDNSAHWNS